MKSLVIPFFHILYQIKIAVIWGAMGHLYWGAMGHCPKVPQPSEFQHQVPLEGSKHSVSLLEFDINLSRL